MAVDARVARQAAASDADRDLINFARELVSIPSLSGEEQRVSERLADELRRLAYEAVEIDRYGNVSARFGPEPAALMFNGHIDHVPPSDMEAPYAAELVDGSTWGVGGPVLRGRGSCDMKANVVAGAYAVRYLAPNTQLARGYRIVADVREETDEYEGLPYYIDHAPLADVAISGESTGLDIALGHRGKVQFEITITGRSSHTSRPDDGVNAVYAAARVIVAIEQYAAELPLDEFYGAATAALIHIVSAPDRTVAVVPARCVIRMDRRFLPNETPDSVDAEVREFVASTCARFGIDATVELIAVYPLMATDRANPIVGHALDAVEGVTGRRPRLTTWDFGVSATFLNAAGVPSIGIGPGDERYAHTPDEHVPVADLTAAARIYARLIERVCTSPAAVPSERA
jgi:putative selenium metabolism hydrolase